MIRKFYQVNSFTTIPEGGNPAGIVLDGEDLNTDQMQQIACGLGFSETAFVAHGNEFADYEVRFFTPTKEVDLCGHATIATFYVLAKTKSIEGPFEGKIILKQDTLAGILPIELTYSGGDIVNVLMTQSKPKFGKKIYDISTLSEIMGIDASETGLPDIEIYPQLVSTGLFDIMMPVKNRKILDKIDPDIERLIDYSNTLGVTGVHAFTLEREENLVVYCRNFAPAFGITEESATGTANGALGAFLIKNNVLKFRSGMEIISIQGIKMNRPSSILIRLEGTEDDFIIKVGGSAIIIEEKIVSY